MSRRLLLAAGGPVAELPGPIDPVDPEPEGWWPETDDPILEAIRPTSARFVATRSTGPSGDATIGASLVAGQAIQAATDTPYGPLGPDYAIRTKVAAGDYAGFGSGAWCVVVGASGDPEDVVVFSDTAQPNDGVTHPYGPIYVEGVTLKAGYNAGLDESPKYCAHIAGSPYTVYANVVFDATEADTGGNAGTVGMDGGPATYLLFYKSVFRAIPGAPNHQMNLHGGPAGKVPVKVLFIDCDMPVGCGYSAGFAATDGPDELYVIGGTLGGNIYAGEGVTVYTDHDNPVVGGATVVRDHTAWPVPDEGRTDYIAGAYFPTAIGQPGQVIHKPTVTDAAPMNPVPGRIYYSPVPIETADIFAEHGVTVHTAAGTWESRVDPDPGVIYGSDERADHPEPVGLQSPETLPSGVAYRNFYYAFREYPLTTQRGNRMWVNLRFSSALASISGSAELPGMHSCYYSDDEGATIVQATEGTPFPIAHIRGT